MILKETRSAHTGWGSASGLSPIMKESAISIPAPPRAKTFNVKVSSKSTTSVIRLSVEISWCTTAVGIFGNWIPQHPQNEKIVSRSNSSPAAAESRDVSFMATPILKTECSTLQAMKSQSSHEANYSRCHTGSRKLDNTGSAMVCGTGCHAGFRMDVWQPFQMILLRRKKTNLLPFRAERNGLMCLPWILRNSLKNPMHSRLVESSRWSTLPDILIWCSPPAGWNCT